MTPPNTDIERTSLEAHVSLCEMRYQGIEKRLTKLEQKLEDLGEKVDNFRLDFFKIMVGTAGSIITAIIAALSIIKWH